MDVDKNQPDAANVKALEARVEDLKLRSEYVIQSVMEVLEIINDMLGKIQAEDSLP